MINKNYIVSFLLLLLLLLCIVLIKIPDSKYTHTFGQVTNRRVDIINITSAEKQTMGINIYVNRLKYRFEASFEFYVGNKKFESTFYNNGYTSDYYTKEILEGYWHMFPKGKKIKIYYNKHNYLDCGINLSQIKKGNSKIYYLFSFITICTLLYLLFFSNFFINE